jgi:hypothetical protein
MKIQKIFMLCTFISVTLINTAWAHCPAEVKEEKVCLMLDANMLYIYDHKVEHNGPYKDFENADMKAIRDFSGQNLEFKKVARGIFKLVSPLPKESKGIKVEITVDSGKIKREIVVKK